MTKLAFPFPVNVPWPSEQSDTARKVAIEKFYEICVLYDRVILIASSNDRTHGYWVEVHDLGSNIYIPATDQVMAYKEKKVLFKRKGI